MALLPAASHAHRLCQPALPICQVTGAGADMIQSPSTEYPVPVPTQGHVLCLCHMLLQTLLTSTRQSRAQPPTSGEQASGRTPLPQPIPQVRVGRLPLGSEKRYQGPQKRLPVTSTLHESPDSLAR